MQPMCALQLPYLVTCPGRVSAQLSPGSGLVKGRVRRAQLEVATIPKHFETRLPSFQLYRTLKWDIGLSEFSEV